MENKKRYSFSGFTFGKTGLAVLKISSINPNEYNTVFGMVLELELTTEERQELIVQLITLNEKDNA